MKNTLVISILLLGIGTAIFFVTMHNRSLESRFAKEGIITKARVVKQFTSRPDRRSNPQYFLRVAYISESGSAHELNENVIEDFWNRHPKGSPVEVRYLKSAPDTAAILGGATVENSYTAAITASIVLFAGGLVLLALRLLKKIP